MGKYLRLSDLKGFKGITDTHLKLVFTKHRVSQSYKPRSLAPLSKEEQSLQSLSESGQREGETAVKPSTTQADSSSFPNSHYYPVCAATREALQPF